MNPDLDHRAELRFFYRTRNFMGPSLIGPFAPIIDKLSVSKLLLDCTQLPLLSSLLLLAPLEMLLPVASAVAVYTAATDVIAGVGVPKVVAVRSHIYSLCCCWLPCCSAVILTAAGWCPPI